MSSIEALDHSVYKEFEFETLLNLLRWALESREDVVVPLKVISGTGEERPQCHSPPHEEGEETTIEGHGEESHAFLWRNAGNAVGQGGDVGDAPQLPEEEEGENENGRSEELTGHSDDSGVEADDLFGCHTCDDVWSCVMM